jgi:hypothetical protein
VVALTQELHEIVENDRYPFSPRIRTLRGYSPSSDRSRSGSTCPRRGCMRRHEPPGPGGGAPAIDVEGISITAIWSRAWGWYGS